MSADYLARRLLAWSRRHGRRHLPWQQAPTPYRVWVSEIMLQQTRVETVIPYFERFVRRFPDVRRLADAEIDEVLHLWSGLGYYARARNLHATARLVRDRHDGVLPVDIDALTALPGIGRSTAGAILSLACGERHPILDGNVRRVLCRFHGIDGWPGQTGVQQRLWTLAEQHTPLTQVAAYTQGIMDLGATVCTRTRPDCPACPLQRRCRARAAGRQHELPAAKPARTLPVRRTVFLILRGNDGRVLLERRPPAGVWGGLWSLPECDPDADPAALSRTRYGCEPRALRPLAPLRHSFSHFHLDISPLLVEVSPPQGAVMEDNGTLWYKAGDASQLGLAAPVARLLSRLDPQPPGVD